jgi:DNA-binding beta-propeller fold protein YncE
MKLKLAIALGITACSILLVSQNAPVEHVGPLPDGGFLLNNGWILRPAGQQVDVDTFPMRAALSQNGKYLLVLNGGYNPPSISVIDTASRHEVHRVPVADAWLGLILSPDGSKVYVGGGSKARVYEFSFSESTGALSPARVFDAVADPPRPGKAFIGDVAISPDAHLLYAADLLENRIAVINLQSGRLIDQWKCGRRPYRILVLPDGKSFLVSSWADAAVYHYDATSGGQIGMMRVAPHPTDLLWLNKPAPTDESTSTSQSPYVARLLVAAANTNNVYSYGMTSNGTFRQIEAINASITSLQPLGMTPSALAVDKSGKLLYVACSDANTIAVVDISNVPTRIVGYIPTGWYPTSVTALDDGGIAIVNGKGRGSKPNPRGPNPTIRPEPLHRGVPSVQYVGRIQTGTVQFVPPFDAGQLDLYTNTVYRGTPYNSDRLRTSFIGANVDRFAKKPNRPSPIQHVIYIIKENRTYDQVLGDMPKGNGDKSLTLFGENITPNLHKLAGEFILYDNFYVNADVSAEGHNWSSAAIAPDYTVKMWPNSYAGRRKTYDYEGGEPANLPPAGYIWTNALAAGVSLRVYGIWDTNLPANQVRGSRQIARVKDPALQPYEDMDFRAFDLDYLDMDRAKEFLREWKDFEEKGEAPQFIVMRIPNDHTAGVTPGKLTPLSLAADNDYAVGTIVDAVSRSKFWPSTAIFIIEDDAQNGPDHVDSHRSPAWVISPYTHRGVVDSTMYNQTSILRTIEAILGLNPMTQFDASSRTMFGSFSSQPDTKPYTVEKPHVSMTDRNPANGPGAKDSAKMDFSVADDIDDDKLNDILWLAIRKTDPPVPVRSAFGQ